jgi:TatD DNase family protein
VIKYFDIHSHLNHLDYKDDISEVVQRLEETDTHTIVVGTNYETSRRAVELAERHSSVYACIGIHPVDNPTEQFRASEFESLVSSSKVVAVGECGMDFFHTKKEEDYDRQRELFVSQISFATEHNKPIMIHARNSYEEVLEVLEALKAEYGDRLRGNAHFFAGDRATAERFFKVGFTVSFTGVITFTHDYDEVIKSAPLEMIHAETDAPYVTPVPYRGKRNEPSYVGEVVKKIAEIRGEDFETVQKALISNACRTFGLVLE